MILPASLPIASDTGSCLLERERGSPPATTRRVRAPIPLPAPLASTTAPPAQAFNIIDLPRLRWAARCHDRQFENGCVATHAHDETEIVYCTRGTVQIDVAGETMTGRPGDLFVLPPTVPHALTSREAWENVCVLFTGSEALIDLRPRVIPLGAPSRIRRWFSDLCALYEARPETPGPTVDALLLAILADAAERERQSHRLQSFHPRLVAALDHLQVRVGRHVSADELARATRTSYSHLSALFRDRFGCGPLDYHRTRRIERAQNLLLDPYLSVGEVARRVGFDDLSYFVRVFRKTVGIPPNRWRQTAGRARSGESVAAE